MLSLTKVELFNSYFSSVFTPQSTSNVNTGYLNIYDQSFVCLLLSELTLSVNEVAKSLMTSRKPVVPMGFQPDFLKNVLMT